MIFTQHYLACLSHASYLIGDETTGRAVVVDPRRDVGIYVDQAATAGLTIERIIETHVHADFLSGHLELAARTGAVISYGAGALVEFAVESLFDGDSLSLGQVTLDVLATPGHTPESICLVVYERRTDRAPYGVLTGDTLFVGDVGRPDLLASGGADLSAEVLARSLYRSLHRKLMRLPDSTRVFPAHGAGSSCGRQLSSETSSTIGEQRRSNYALQLVGEDAFVGVVTEGQPPRPQYFAFDARRNRERHSLLDDSPPPLLSLDEVLRQRDAGAVLLDPREPADFAAAHLHRAVNVGLQGRFAEWAANVLPADRDIVLVGPPSLSAEAKLRLGRVGYDRVIGQLDDLAEVIGHQPAMVAASSRLRVDQLADLIGCEPGLQVVDVRGASETRHGTLPGAREIPLAVLVDAATRLDRSRSVVVYCATGSRSQVAASVLRNEGFADVSDLLGGAAAWEAAGLAMERGRLVHRVDPLNCETSIPALIGGEIVPVDRFYVRSHFTPPEIDAAGWQLAVTGSVERRLRLSMGDLRALPSHTLVTTLECAGNGRAAFEPAVPGEQWGYGAVSTAEWTGVPLTEVLDRATPRPDAIEVLFRGADSGTVDEGDTARFERSLPLDQARHPDVLIAYAMNGEPLPLQHGYPVRLIVPGWYAVASVKWLTEICLLDTAFTGYFQANRYMYEWRRDGTAVCEPVHLQHVRSLITEPSADAELRPGEIMVRGVAWSGAAPIDGVDISVGEGPWTSARMIGERRARRWQWWEVLVAVDGSGPTTVRSRATDAAGRVQPERAEWNRLGYGNNSIQVVPINIR